MRSGQEAGLQIVALGRRVESALARGRARRYLPHPAARGRVRGRETYRALVAQLIAVTGGRRP